MVRRWVGEQAKKGLAATVLVFHAVNKKKREKYE